MKYPMIAAVGGATLGLVGAVVALRQRRGSRGPGALRYLDTNKLSFKPLVPGVSCSVIWGDPERGPYAMFTRFEPGSQYPLHMHTNDITQLVLSGAYIYRYQDREIRVGPGGYLFLPGRQPHESGGDPIEGCLFYQESPGAFDINYLDASRQARPPRRNPPEAARP
jgi:hypothetical protein